MKTYSYTKSKYISSMDQFYNKYLEERRENKSKSILFDNENLQ